MMKNLSLILLFIACFFSCKEADDQQHGDCYEIAYANSYIDPYVYSEYEPNEVPLDELSDLISFQEPFEVEESGKIYIKDDLMIVGEGDTGFHFFDNSDPKNPIQEKFLNIHGTSDIAIRDNYFYINQYKDLVTLKIDLDTYEIEETGREKEVFNFNHFYGKQSPDGYYFSPRDGEKIIIGFTKKENFKKPNLPEYSTSNCYEELATTDSNTGGAVDGQGGSLARFILKGDYLYTVDGNKLNTFLISETNVQNPSFMDSSKVGFSIETLFSNGNYLFIGSQLGMYIYSIEENPSTPVYVSEAQHLRACDPVISNGKYAFVTVHSSATCGGSLNELFVYNIEDDISNPKLLIEKTMIEPKGISLYQNYLLVADKAIRVLDISNVDTNEIEIISKVSVDVNDFVLIGDHLFAIGDTAVYQYQLSVNGTDLEFELLSELSF